HSAMRSALATLAGEKTVFVASSVRIWNRSAPSAASAAAGTFRTVRTYPPRMKAWPDELVHDRGYQTVPERGGGVPARRPGQEHRDPDRDRGSHGQGGRLGRGAVRLVATGRRAGRGRVHAHAGLPPPALPGERPGRWPAGGDLTEARRRVPGVNAGQEAADAFAAAWRDRTGAGVAVYRRMRLFRLGELIP